MKVRVRELLESGLWSRYCEASGTNEWAVNEGLLDASAILALSPTVLRRMLRLPKEESEDDGRLY